MLYCFIIYYLKYIFIRLYNVYNIVALYIYMCVFPMYTTAKLKVQNNTFKMLNIKKTLRYFFRNILELHYGTTNMVTF